ncbi:MAG TPA: hypothetical protein VJS42_19330 [Steroidobacteraceae bacterium]|nr:hypothetical protein [Steroidobacteraceae bacterium]
MLAAALLAFQLFDSAAATALILTTHIVLTVAHHLPTFARVYGDVDLFRRYRWSFVLGPIVPLAFSAAALGYLNYKRYPLDYFLYVYLFLALWDPWHFLRQHYGFMRLYDRANAAPRALAGRMDWWLCATWFVYIMLASGSWLAGFLEDLQTSVHINALLMLPAQWVAPLTGLTRDLALLTTVAYVGYTAWCWYKGYFISLAKLALFAIMFGALYFAYTPNPWVLRLAPEWSFKVGFAAIGVVHVTQYFAVTWRYNRGLTTRAGRARSGWFERVHRRGGAWLAMAYIGLGLLYGGVITTPQANSWVMSVLLAVGFTSTLLHYYFDGFIWKVRHHENHESLGFPRVDGSLRTVSWWSTARRRTPLSTVARQLLYFGVPLAVLTAGAWSVWNAPPSSYITQMYRAQIASERGDLTTAAQAARAAYAAMTAQLPVTRKLQQLDPSASRTAELAYLVYNHSHYRHVVLPMLDGREVAPQLAAHRASVARAVALLEVAMASGQPLNHAGRDQLTRADAERARDAWRRILTAG